MPTQTTAVQKSASAPFAKAPRKRRGPLTGPFAVRTHWQVFNDDHTEIAGGPAPLIKIVTASKISIAYTRKDARYDPKGEIVHRAKVRRVPGVSNFDYEASVGGYQHIKRHVASNE